MANDFEIGGKKFKIGKISAIEQYHIVRRIGPVLSEMLPVIWEIQKLMKSGAGKSPSQEQQFDQIIKFATPFMNGLSKLSDQDSERVLFGLLASIEVQYAGAWSKVVSGGILMMQDLEFPVLVQLAGRAFMHNIASFFTALPQQ